MVLFTYYVDKDDLAEGCDNEVRDEDEADNVGGEGVSEGMDKPTFSKKYLERLSLAWKGRREMRRKKRLSNRKKKW